MSLRRPTKLATLRGVALSALLVAVTAGCSAQPQSTGQITADTDTAVSAESAYHGGVQEVGIVGKVQLSTPDKQLKDASGFKADCLVTFIPKLNFRAPKGGGSDLGVVIKQTAKPRTGEVEDPPAFGATGTDWCLGLHKGASYLVFWDPEANIHFDWFDNRPKGGKVLVKDKRTDERYCKVSFIGPDLSDKPYLAGPFPKDYCDAVRAH